MASIFLKGAKNPIQLAEKKDIPQTNLYVGTSDFSGTNWESAGYNYLNKNLTDTKLDPNGNIAFHNFAPWAGTFQKQLFVKAGDIFTLGAYVFSPTNKNDVYFQAYTLDSNGGDGSILHKTINGQVVTLSGHDIIKSSQSELPWSWITITAVANSDHNVKNPFGLRIESANNRTFYIGSMTMVKGTHCPKWIPSIKDYVMRSDYDALSNRLSALESKMGG
ncbi:hypothetical protein [Lactobacillus sp. HT06-2]|nr:hypothetical protein [Lactobacillus sp. HT06-2]